MSKIFIDEDGRKWEATMPSVDREHVVIRRLELQEPEWEVNGSYFGLEKHQDITIWLNTVKTEAQFYALKASIEALMELVYNRDFTDVEVGNEEDLVEAIDKARTLIQKGKE